jgi:cystathionine beta-lyase/cystathionine gamma-synthase
MSKLSIQTLAVHGGEKPDPTTGAIAPILVRTKTYKQSKFGTAAPWQYSRGKNPTRSILEEKLAIMEGGGKATVFSSGTAAMAMFFLSLDVGDHIIFCNETYGGTSRLISSYFEKWQLKASFADFNDLAAVREQITPNTKYFYIETPTNPSLNIIDLHAMHRLSRTTGIPYVADMTFSPVCCTKAFEYGAETVIHSLSKYFAGHNDTLAGAVVTKNSNLYEDLQAKQRNFGAILSPDECYRVIQGSKTLSIRWSQVSRTAQIVAEYLTQQPEIKKVFYPGLPSHTNHAIASKQMKNGFGSVISFVLHSTINDTLEKFVTNVQKGGIITYAESLASPETILSYPAYMSHASIDKDTRDNLGIVDGFFRLSVGLEDANDIINAIRRAL